tara:strand:- start:969 stop:1652 length:684 start_codon:yes stop_codon:yes gene_type:complete
MPRTKLIIFGTGIISDCLSPFFENCDCFDVIAYCVDNEFKKADTFRGKPIISLEDLDNNYGSQNFKIFVALGYHDLNKLREKKFNYFKSKGYTLVSFIPESYKSVPIDIGENCLILPGANIQPHCKIEDNTFIWNDALVGHHTLIKKNVWITGGSAIGGLCEIGENCFLGLNVTVGPCVTIGDNCILGAKSLTTKCLKSNSVVVEQDTSIHRLDSNQFLKLTKAFSN